MTDKISGELVKKVSDSDQIQSRKFFLLKKILPISSIVVYAIILLMSFRKCILNADFYAIVHLLTSCIVISQTFYILVKRNKIIINYSLLVTASLVLSFVLVGDEQQISYVTFILIPFLSIWAFDKLIGSVFSIIPLLVIFIVNLIKPDLIPEYTDIEYLILPYNVFFLIALFKDYIFINETGSKAETNETIKQDKLKFNQELLRTLINSLPDMIYIKSRNGKFRKINEALAYLFNVENVEMAIDKDEKDFLEGEIANEIGAFDQDILERGEIIHDRIFSVHNESDGLNYFSCTKVPVKNSRDEIIGMIGIIRDISEQVEIENEINRYIEELQVNRDQSEEAAGQLAYLNVKLTESEEKLKDLNANKDKFFSIISHDLKSPFTSLLGFSDFLLNDIDEMDKDEIKEFVQSINSSAKGVFKLLQNLLEWSRVQTNRIEFLPGLFDLSELIYGLKDIYQVNFLQKSIKFVTDVEPDIKAFADKNMIETVLRNLISNAIKFTPNGKSIRIAARPENDTIYVSVRDEGVGISEENMKKLFRIDEHLTTEGTNAEKGTGLGLILCKEFINKNGGEISVKSEMDKGSEFYFHLQTTNVFVEENDQ